MLQTVVHEGKEFDLNICGVGPDAYFEWTNKLGDPVGDVFRELPIDAKASIVRSLTE